MGWLNPKCPICGGTLQATGYCAPHPTHRCHTCIANSIRDREVKLLRNAITKLENGDD